MDEELMSVPVPLGAEPPALHHEDDVHDGHVTHVGDDAQKKADGVVVDDVHDKEHIEDDDESDSVHHHHHHHHHAHHDDVNDDGGARRRPRGNSSGGGRTRVNDKGEPAMMLPSFIWDYFIKENSGKYVICTLCPDQSTRFAYSGGTSTMNRHLRKKHQKFAPGKCAADYEYSKSGKRTSPRSSVSSGLTSDAAASLGNLSPNEAGRRHLIDMRNSRRRASTKRRKLLHPSLLDADQNAVAAAAAAAYGSAAAAQAAEFDPSGFVNLQSHNASSPGTGLQFPQGFELGDATMDMGGAGMVGDQRFFDYATLAGPSSALGFRNRRSNGPNQKVLTHRLLKYLIAQYEPLDVSRMGMELNVLLYGTDYPSTKLPSEETLKLALANLYYSQREILKEVIAEVEMLSLSLNNWKSVFGQNVLTVSGHWISNGFSRRDCVLEVYVLPLDESVNTIALLRDVMDKWDIPSSKVAALTMIKNGKEEAIHEEYPGLSVVNCFVNVLDSAVTAGLLKCAPLIRRCRNYVSYFIQNPSEYQIFLSLQRKVAEASVGLHHDGTAGGDVDPSANGGVGEDDSDVKAGAGSGAGTGSPKLSGAAG
uniref:BED-type domain-containing protein n=1 Tax=Globisporangium ultimum (strain ATCC 200006 / CBS 805.95 / DAOM BR144) TaxID=431595 RepID=K3WXP5_GLOUD